MNASRGRQLVLDLPHRAALSREDFLVTKSNAAAVALIDSWPQWPSPAVLLVGPPGSGKSHLVEVWRTASGAARISSDELNAACVPELVSNGAVAIEDLPGNGLDERALFHLLNYAREKDVRVLLSSRGPATAWSVSLPDLASRLKAASVISLASPDDELLQGALLKQFSDRQIRVDHAIVSYILTRMPRSMEAARTIVAAIDQAALEERAEVTRPFVAKVLAGYAEPPLFGASPEP
jgi:chromosomal replication initiation ATPase DnaA